MAKREKCLERLKQRIKDVSFEELRKVLEDNGLVLKNVTGSHHTFHAKIGSESYRITIPHHRPVKPVYVKMAIELIELIIAQQGDEAADDNGNEQEAEQNDE